MKTNVLMKIALVFMAAFGAYAFSADTSSQNMFTRSDTCQNITAECSNQLNGETCMIQVEGNVIPVLDTDCSLEVKHINSQPVNWY